MEFFDWYYIILSLYISLNYIYAAKLLLNNESHLVLVYIWRLRIGDSWPKLSNNIIDLLLNSLLLCLKKAY